MNASQTKSLSGSQAIAAASIRRLDTGCQ